MQVRPVLVGISLCGQCGQNGWMQFDASVAICFLPLGLDGWIQFGWMRFDRVQVGRMQYRSMQLASTHGH